MSSEDQRALWTAGASGWIEHERLFDAIYAPATAAVLEAADLRAGTTVLDVGCGSGTLLSAALQVGSRPTGIDISPGMVEAAQARAPQAEVVLGDAQGDDLRELAAAPFERVISRFGVMFFPDPVAAFANLRAAATPDARMAFACWRSLAENSTFTLGLELLTRRLAEVQGPLPPIDPNAPGPTAFADPDRVRHLLQAGGWQQITVDAVDFACDYGAVNGTDGVEERLAVLLSGVRGRQARAKLEPLIGTTGWDELVEEIRQQLRDARDPESGTLRQTAAIWLVQAANVRN